MVTDSHTIINRAADVKYPLRRSTNPFDALSGTQSIQRAILILKEISAYGRNGMRLVDIANTMHLERPTIHRIMRGLMSQGMAVQDAKTKTYRLGPAVYELGLAAVHYHNLREICQPTLRNLAHRTGDSVFLTLRSGMDSVCIDCIEGNFIMENRTLDIGGRLPLGVGAGGLALLLQLGDEEIQAVMATNAPRFLLFRSLTDTRLRKAIELSRKVGYAVNDEDVLPGVAAIGAPIVDSGGTCYAAISIAGIASRLQKPRRDRLAELLLKEVRLLTSRIQSAETTADYFS